jgi:hypothetical protein
MRLGGFTFKNIAIKNVLGIYSLKNVIVEDVVGYYDNSIIREIVTFQTYHDYPIEIFYISCFIISCFIIHENLLNMKKTKKIKKITDKETIRCINVFIIIFTMIFTKNIENAI